MAAPIVSIKDGKLKGIQKIDIDGGNIYGFLAIPYAKPPVGKLRFRAPEPVEPWNAIRDATKDGEPCYQRKEAKLKPVMFWIHGGAFIHGHNKSDLYGPEYLLTKDIVLVTVNYRLGFLGFLHLNDQSLDVPGNAGIKDQQAALRWVQENIKHFNGDPNNVTVFGESAGGACVHYHIISPRSKGLFHKAIAQSGCFLSPWAHSGDFGLKFAKTIKEDVKNEKEALELLESMPVEVLYEFQEKFIEKNGFWGIVSPTVEYPNKTAAITEFPPALLQSGQYNKIPIMIGYTNREGLLFKGMQNLAKAAGKHVPENTDLSKMIHPFMNLAEDDPKRQLILQKYKEFYFQGKNAEDKVLFFSDFFFVPSTIGSAILHSKTSSEPVYLYRVSLDAGYNMFKKMCQVDEPGACHADDLGYLFSSLLADKLKQHGPLETKSVKRFVELWTNFAIYGNPTPKTSELNIVWEPVDAGNVKFLDIDKDITLQAVDDNEEAESLKFWRDIFAMSPYTKDLL